ncbi:MAG: hypothetical protein JXD22_11055 [Sedimentisphaerales bacterium]|nr:hypothetical protein [Sedimentisphaerales bacterium]
MWDNQGFIDFMGDTDPFFIYESKHMIRANPQYSNDPYYYGYWAVPFRDYTDRMELYHCPDARYIDDWRDYGYGQFVDSFYNASYGVVGALRKAKMGSILRPLEETVLCMDHIESECNAGADGDGQKMGYSDLPCMSPTGGISNPQ